MLMEVWRIVTHSATKIRFITNRYFVGRGRPCVGPLPNKGGHKVRPYVQERYFFNAPIFTKYLTGLLTSIPTSRYTYSMAKQGNCRKEILDAAQTVVMEAGAGHMSLDMVAKKAGVSKGGLMYHFPTKESLLKAMILRMIEQFYADREEKKNAIKKPAGRLLKAGIMATLERDQKRDRMSLAILAAAAHAPHLLQPLREAYRVHMKEMQQGDLKFERAAVASLAADGLMLHELLGISSYTVAQKNSIRDEMMGMIDEGVLR